MKLEKKKRKMGKEIFANCSYFAIQIVVTNTIAFSTSFE